MSTRNYFRLLAYSGLLVQVLATGTAIAAEPKTGDGGVAIRKAQGMIRQLSQEKSALEAEKSAWLIEKTALEDRQKILEEAVRKLQPLQAEVERYKSGLESLKTSLEAQLGQERQGRQNLLQKHNEVVNKAKAINADNQLLVQAVEEREQWIEQCGSRNKELDAANQDILHKYREKGLVQQLLELEPFTGIAKVETQTTAEDYRYKLQQLKITPFKAAEKKPEPTAINDEMIAEEEARQ